MAHISFDEMFRITFIVLPQRNGHTFPYSQQRRRNGDCLKGENSTASRRTYPKVEVHMSRVF